MEQEPKEINPYQDPALMEQSGGDDILLSRLAALQTAGALLAQDPENTTWINLFDSVDMSVKERQRQLGILPPEEGANT